MKILILVIVLSYLFVGCRGLSHLHDYPIPKEQSDEDNLRRSAPIVVVGTVERESVAGPVVHSAVDPEMLVQLHAVRVNIENVLRGDLSPGRHLIYSFYIASSYEGPPPLGAWMPGRPEGGYRRLFYLRRDSGIVRTVCDVKNYCAYNVGSGSHPNYRRDSNEPITVAIADLLLTKGEGVTDQQFADSLVYEVNLVPHQLAVEKLKELTKNNSTDVRQEACSLLLTNFGEHVRNGCT